MKSKIIRGVAYRDWLLYMKTPWGLSLCSLFFLYCVVVFVYQLVGYNVFLRTNPFLSGENNSVYNGLFQPFYKSMIFFVMFYIPLTGIRFFSSKRRDDFWFCNEISANVWILSRFLSLCLFYSVLSLFTIIFPLSIKMLTPWSFSLLEIVPLLLSLLFTVVFYSMLCVFWLYQQDHQILNTLAFFICGILFFVIDQTNIFFIKELGFSFRLWHLSLGVMEWRDFVYFVIITAVFFQLTKIRIIKKYPML